MTFFKMAILFCLLYGFKHHYENTKIYFASFLTRYVLLRTKCQSVPITYTSFPFWLIYTCRLIKSQRNTPYLVNHYWSWATYCPLWLRHLVQRKMPPGVMTATFPEEFWSGSQRSHLRSELWSADGVFFHAQWPMGRKHAVIHFTRLRAMMSVINYDDDAGKLRRNRTIP